MLLRVRNGKVFRDGVFRQEDILFSGGVVAPVSTQGPSISIDARNMVVFPGFADVHVHLREPGFS